MAPPCRLILNFCWCHLILSFSLLALEGERGEEGKGMGGQPDVKRSSKVDRVLANQTLGSTASLLTSNIPFAWFLVLGCNRQAQNLFYFCLASYSRSNTRGQRDDRELTSCDRLPGRVKPKKREM